MENGLAQIQAFPDKDAAIAALQTIQAILRNIVQHPGEAKYQRINTTGKVFMGKILPVPGTIDVLLALGFVEDLDGLVLRQPQYDWMTGELFKLDPVIASLQPAPHQPVAAPVPAKPVGPVSVAPRKSKIVDTILEAEQRAHKVLPPSFWDFVASVDEEQVEQTVSLLKSILERVLKNPGDESVLKFKSTAVRYQEHVSRFAAGTDIITACGYVPRGEFLAIPSPNYDEMLKIRDALQWKLDSLAADRRRRVETMSAEERIRWEDEQKVRREELRIANEQQARLRADRGEAMMREREADAKRLREAAAEELLRQEEAKREAKERFEQEVAKRIHKVDTDNIDISHLLVKPKDDGARFVGSEEQERLRAQQQAILKRTEEALQQRLQAKAAANWCVLQRTPNDEVLSWGANKTGQLGHGDIRPRLEPDLVTGIPNVAVSSVVCGSNHTFVLMCTGELLACGSGKAGVLGHGSTAYAPKLYQIKELRDVVVRQVASIGSHTLVLSQDGRVFAFGDDSFGQLGGLDPPEGDDDDMAQGANDNDSQDYDTGDSDADSDDQAPPPAVPVQPQPGLAGPARAARSPNWRATPWLNDKLDAATDGRKISMVAAGAFHSAVLTADGLVYTFGRGDLGQLGHGVLGREANQRVPAWVQRLPPKVTFIACGLWHSCAISEGRLYTWGQNEFGQLGLGHTRTTPFPECVGSLGDRQVVSVSCGAAHTVIVCRDGSVFVCGNGANGRLGTGSAANALAPVKLDVNISIVEAVAGWASTLVVSHSGNLYAAGDVCQEEFNTLSLLSVLNEHHAIKAAAGSRHLVSVVRNDTEADKLGKLVGSRADADVHFMVDGQTVHAHRAILSCVGRGFDVVDQFAGSVMPIQLPGVTCDVFMLFLGFCYTGYVDFSRAHLMRQALPTTAVLTKVVPPLLELARKFQVNGLVDLLEVTIALLNQQQGALERNFYRDGVWQMQLGRLLQTSQFSDVEFHVSGQETGDEDAIFRAHRCVLSACSDYFHNMLEFETSAQSTTSKVIPIVGVTPLVFRLLLHFVYTQMLPVSPVEQLCELLQLADMYTMPELKRAVTMRIIADRCVTVDNAPYVYQAASASMCASLMGHVLDFTFAKQAQVRASPLFERFGGPELFAAMHNRQALIKKLV
eukprot:TRINITY_DN7775_c0_g1_i1.p2 TRINITY_DN7775_c0_g1~~TRINITY_DN7775_c0_g1_i1.p2  ORF type:complete len:1160 (-),score=258.39 TRINITY_DN7775_c0_g1_i1:5449-8883(-)